MNKSLSSILILASLFLTSCGENSSAYKGLKQQYDSLQMISSTHAENLHLTDSLTSAILNNFQNIEDVQQMIVEKSLEGGRNQKDHRQRIIDNMNHINKKLAENEQTLQALIQKFKGLNMENKGLANTIKALRMTVVNQKSRMLVFQEELEKKTQALNSLDREINSLNNDLEKLNIEKLKQLKEIEERERLLNTVYYCVGTEDDLTDMKILKNGEICSIDIIEGYFREIDLRKETKIETYAKKFKLLTHHDPRSYYVMKDRNGLKTIIIKSPKDFWKSSRRLIIEVE